MVISEPKIVDFVVVLEATANLVDHWDSILKSYILPALEYFNGKASAVMDYIGNNGNSHYGYVLFHSGDSSLDPMTTSAVLQSPSLFVRKLKDISFNGGGSERCCFVAEGLGRALKVFDDIANKRRQRESTKICILVCGSPPYNIPCTDTREHSGKSYDELAKSLGSRDIHLSVISPHHIKQMKDIYRVSNQPKSPIMNYAQDLRHLVLISGFELPTEQAPVKVEPNDGAVKMPVVPSRPTNVVPSSSPVTLQTIRQALNTSSPYGLNTSAPNPPMSKPNISVSSASLGMPTLSVKHEHTSLPPSSTHFPATSMENELVQAKPNISSFAPPNTGNQQYNSPRPSNFGQASSNVNPSFTNVDRPDNSQDIKPAIPTVTLPTPIPPFQPMNNNPPNSVKQTPNFSMQPKQPNVTVTQSNIQWPSQPVSVSYAPQVASQPTNDAQRTANDIMIRAMQQPSPIWKGMLEWNERRGTSVEDRIVRRINCEFVLRNPSEDNLGSNLWPEKLTMQLVPRIILNTDYVKAHMKNHTVVNFIRVSPHDQFVQLRELMSQRWMGVITVQGPGMQLNVDSRVILVIHIAKTGQICGLVSREAASLINAIKHALKNRNPGQQPNQTPQTSMFNAGRPTNVQPNQHQFRPNMPTRPNEVSAGMMNTQPRQIDMTSQQQYNNPVQTAQHQNFSGQPDPGMQQNRYQTQMFRSGQVGQVVNQMVQQRPRMRLPLQQAQQPQITLRTTHGGDNVRALLTVGNNNMNQQMNQPQQQGILPADRMGQASNMGFMPTQQMQHPINPRGMGMSQQRFGM